MLSTLFRRLLTPSPSFDRRRSFAGSVIYSCRQTGEDYSIIPAGPVGFYVAGGGGRYIARAANHTDAAGLIQRDARDQLRAAVRLAA
jgi:hypothetical protein